MDVDEILNGTSWLEEIRNKKPPRRLLLSERFHEWVMALPRAVVKRGLLVDDVADALGCSEVRALDLLVAAGFFWPRPVGWPEGMKLLAYPPWAPSVPGDQNVFNRARVGCAPPDDDWECGWSCIAGFAGRALPMDTQRQVAA